MNSRRCISALAVIAVGLTVVLLQPVFRATAQVDGNYPSDEIAATSDVVQPSEASPDGKTAAEPPLWYAPEPLPEFEGLSGGEAAKQLADVRNDADSARSANDHGRAAELYLWIARSLPESPQAADALLLAAGSMRRTGALEDARAACDDVVNLARKFTVRDYITSPKHQHTPPPLEGTTVDSVRELMKKALAEKASIGLEARDPATAHQAVEEFRAEFPEYPDLRKVLDVQAALAGEPIDSLRGREREAWMLSDKAKWAWENGDADTSLAAIDQLLNKYAGTGAVPLALRTRARVLWRLKRHDELRATCQQLLDLVHHAAPECELARFAAAKIAYYDVGRLYRSYLEEGAVERPTRDEWTTVRDLCYEIMAKEQDPLARAVAHSVILSSHFWEGDYEKVVAAEDELLEHHGRGEAQLSDVSYRRILITAELNACESLSRLRRFPEALRRCEYAIALLEGEPFLPEAEYDQLANHMYFLRCLTLAQTGRRQELASAAEEFLSRFPASPHRARIEGLMHR